MVNMMEKNETPKILIVDDSEVSLSDLESILEGLDLDIVKVTSGEEALQELSNHDIALILLDVHIPDMDGFEIADLTRRNERTEHIPIIFITAVKKEMMHVFKGYKTGAVDYLFKPLEPQILRSKVRVFLDLFQKNKLIEDQAAALRDSEEIFRAVSDSAKDGIALMDNDGYIKYLNNSAMKILGYTADEGIGKELTSFILPKYHQIFKERFKHFRETGQDSVIGDVDQFPVVKQDGTQIQLEASLSAVKIKDKWCAIAVIRDLSFLFKS